MVAAAVVPIGIDLVPVGKVTRASGVALSDLITVRMLEEKIRDLREKLHEAQRERRRYPVNLLQVV